MKPSTWKPPKESGGACRLLTPEEVIAITHDPSPKVRREALRDMCPCHVKRNVESLWARIMEMANDPDATVRYQVMHNLCDGSPACREDDVIRTLEGMFSPLLPPLSTSPFPSSASCLPLPLLLLTFYAAMHNDPDKKVRRRVHQVLSNYRRTGKWNIL